MRFAKEKTLHRAGISRVTDIAFIREEKKEIVTTRGICIRSSNQVRTSQNRAELC